MHLRTLRRAALRGAPTPIGNHAPPDRRLIFIAGTAQVAPPSSSSKMRA
jgi:hypothetical protein